VSVGSATVTVGDIFTIPFSITNAVNVFNFQFDLLFNPSILQLGPNGVTDTPFFNQGDSTLLVAFALGGDLFVSDSQNGFTQSPVNGSGVLANIEFQAIAPGTSPLTLSGVILNDGVVSDFSVTNGSVCVNPLRGNTCAQGGGGGNVPEPGPLALLFAAGLALLTWRQRTSTR
jgi:hypothetical protein